LNQSLEDIGRRRIRELLFTIVRTDLPISCDVLLYTLRRFITAVFVMAAEIFSRARGGKRRFLNSETTLKFSNDSNITRIVHGTVFAIDYGEPFKIQLTLLAYVLDR
jgi:hypothetical protein